MNRNTASLLALSWQSAAYGIGQFGRGLVIYLTLPLLTRLMSPAEYGVVALMASFIAFTDVVSDAGLPSATLRLYHDANDPEHRRKVLGSSLLLFVIYALVMAAAVYLLAQRLAGWILGDAHYFGLLRIGAALMVMLTLFSFGQILYRIQVRPLANSLAVLLMIIVQTGLALAFVALYGLGAYGYWWGQLIGATFAVLFMLISLRHSLHFSISRSQIESLTQYALPMLPASLSLWALRLIDRPMILHFYDLRQVGIYDLGYKVASLLMLLTTPFSFAWPAFAFSHMKDQDAPQLYRDVLTGVATVATLLGLGIFALRRELVLLFGSVRYVAAVDVVGWVIVGHIALSLFPILSLGPRITKRTSMLAWLNGTAAIINIVLNYLLLPRYGIIGAAIATMVAYLYLAGASYLVGRGEFHFPLDYSRLGKLLIISILCAGYVLVVESFGRSWSFNFVLKVLSIPLFLFLLFATRFVRFSQVREVAKFTLERILQRRRTVSTLP